MLAFNDDTVIAFLNLLRGKAQYRRSDLWLVMEACGGQALPIVSLICFLVGLILAFIGAIQLQLFGAQIYVADLVGIAMVRLMAAIMTGIVMASLDGAIGAVMGEGFLTEYLDLISLNLSQKVVHFWGRPKSIDQIKCAVVQFDIKSGVAASQAFVFDTRAGILVGLGEINLGTEQVDFLLVPKPKHPSLLEFSTKLRVSGTILDSKVRPDKFALLKTGARALSGLVIGPFGLLAPFVHLGAHEKHPCEIQSIGQLELQSPVHE